MSGLSVQLNRLDVGFSHLNSDTLYPPHKQKIEESLSKIFDQHAVLQNQKASIALRFRNGKSSFLVDSKEISLNKSPELKEIDRIVRYYQNTGLLPKGASSHAEEQMRTASTKKSIQQIGQASVPGSNGSILAGMRLADDTLSLVRNIMYAIPALGPKDAIANHLGYYAGIFWTFFALRELDDGLIEYKRSKIIGDVEGKQRAGSRILSGSIVTAGAFSYLTGKICDSFISSSAATALLGASNVLFGLGSCLAVGTSFLGALRCHRFHQKIDEYLKNPALTEEQRMRGVVQFLKNAISVTPEEKADIAAWIEQTHPEWSKETKERFLAQKMADLTEVKVKYMKRRTSNKSLALILNNADPILAKLGDPKRALEGIRDAALLVSEIQKESRIKQSLYLLGMIAALITLVATAVMAFSSGGALPFILYGIAGIIYLGITVYSTAGLILKKDDDMRIIELNPLQGLAHLATI